VVTALSILLLQLTAPIAPRIPPGSVVRMTVASGPRLSGRYLGTTGDSIILKTRAGYVRVGAFRVDSLWTQQRDILGPTLRSAWMGAVMGTAIQLIRGLRVSCHRASGFLSPPACRTTFGSVGKAAAAGAVIAGATGATLRFAFPVWRLRFP